MKIFIAIVLSLFTFSFASAHVTVKPVQTGIATYQTFTVSVPVEKDIPTTQIKLALPEGLESVTPYVKPGWKITKTDKEIVWSGGSIPAEQRDDFLFSAKTPSKEATLVWKAYQTYSDGSVVAWDAAPTSDHDDEKVNPASQTKVINDLVMMDDHHMPTAGFPFGTIAFVISLVALALSLRKR